MESAQVPNDGQENVPVLVHTLKIHAGEFPFIHLGLPRSRCQVPFEGQENVPVLIPSSALKNHAYNIQSE